MSLEEWRQAIHSPPAYRFGNSTLRFQTKYVVLVFVFTVICLLYVMLPTGGGGSSSTINSIDSSSTTDRRFSNILKPSSGGETIGGKKAAILFGRNTLKSQYNSEYPLTKPVSTEKGLRYNIGIISDLDQDSKAGGKWVSYFRRGNLFLQLNKEVPKLSKVLVEWDSGDPHTIKSGLSLDDRGMELSELVAFNGKLYTCDDRTGVIFEIPIDDASAAEVQPIPWVILADGNGTSAKGFKCEWATVKDDHLWVGGLGKDWTTPEGEFVNYNPQFVKKISMTGEVTHISWRMHYQKIQSEMGIHFPGYVVHESAGWSSEMKKWMFLPRRASNDKYNDKTDEKKGTNVMVLADEDFNSVKVTTVGEIVPTHGFSSFKWIPGTQDKLVIALKSEEIEGKTATYIMVFDMEGNILLPETKVGDHKYEGIEFL